VTSSGQPNLVVPERNSTHDFEDAGPLDLTTSSTQLQLVNTVELYSGNNATDVGPLQTAANSDLVDMLLTSPTLSSTLRPKAVKRASPSTLVRQAPVSPSAPRTNLVKSQPRCIRISARRLSRPYNMYHAHADNDAEGTWVAANELPHRLIIDYNLQRFRKSAKRRIRDA